MIEKLLEAISDMKEEEALDTARRLLETGEDPLNILECSQRAMEIVGKRFEEGEYFLPELMMAGDLLRQISELVKPRLKAHSVTARKGKVLVGTVAGDIHNIGKDIVVFLLDVNGFDVRDMGVDVSPEEFVQAIKEFEPQVVGLSGLLTVAYESMKDTVSAISEAGLRDSVKIMIGGGSIGERVVRFAGADAFGKDAMAGVSLAKQWIVA